jgi:hypothetical protein
MVPAEPCVMKIICVIAIVVDILVAIYLLEILFGCQN